MNKQELYDKLTNKLGEVQPVSEWKGIGDPILGVSRYAVQTYSIGKNPVTHTVIVENDGNDTEDAYVQGIDVEDTPVVVSFDSKVSTFINSKKLDNTIVDAIPSVRGTNCSEYFVYKISNNILIKETYLLNLDSKGDIIFRKIG